MSEFSDLLQALQACFDRLDKWSDRLQRERNQACDERDQLAEKLSLKDRRDADMQEIMRINNGLKAENDELRKREYEEVEIATNPCAWPNCRCSIVCDTPSQAWNEAKVSPTIEQGDTVEVTSFAWKGKRGKVESKAGEHAVVKVGEGVHLRLGLKVEDLLLIEKAKKETERCSRPGGASDPFADKAVAPEELPAWYSEDQPVRVKPDACCMRSGFGGFSIGWNVDRTKIGVRFAHGAIGHYDVKDLEPIEQRQSTGERN